jgi:biopolymer transport protein ExbD
VDFTTPINSPAPEYFGYLRLRQRVRRNQARGLLDVAPVADVVLLLLLFFMINSSFVLQPGISVQLPVAPFAQGTSYSSLVVTVAQEGMVFFNDERTTLLGLASGFAQARHEDPEVSLVIEADARVSHGTLVRIYNMATESGIRNISLATRMPGRPHAPPSAGTRP